MRVGDKVQFVLYDKEFTGSIVKVYRKPGWKGYANILVEDNGIWRDCGRIDLPVSFLEVVGEGR